jgi:ATP-dependent RNA helicase DeaD
MPKAIKTVAERYLRDPEHIVIGQVTAGESLIDQSQWVVAGPQKLDALTRILEASETDGILVFVRTKTATVELAEKLEARGYAAAALSGDLSQDQRERTVAKLKKGSLDILVATDVAARGLDVERINMVVNYDIPFDGETYTHRIGRTGRAGRSGTAILFVSPRERGLLRSIERTVGKQIPIFKMPTREDLAVKRTDKLLTKVEAALQDDQLPRYQEVIERLLEKSGTEPKLLAAALCALLNEETPVLVDARHQDIATMQPEAPQGQREGRNRDTRPHRGPPRERSYGGRQRRGPAGSGAGASTGSTAGGGRAPRKWGNGGGEGGGGRKRTPRD